MHTTVAFNAAYFGYELGGDGYGGSPREAGVTLWWPFRLHIMPRAGPLTWPSPSLAQADTVAMTSHVRVRRLGGGYEVNKAPSSGYALQVAESPD